MNITPKAPLFRDPIHDGAADPTIIWNRDAREWWIFYTCRRADAPGEGVAYMHGSDIGIASSGDEGKTWVYRGTARGLAYEPGHNTYWAPEVLEYGGVYHMYVSYVRGIPAGWEYPRAILHYTSTNLWDWTFESRLPLSSDRVIDACVFPLLDGTFKMWYKDEGHESHTYAAVSKDLYRWEVTGPEITDCPHEGPNVFAFQGCYWMLTDIWEGLKVYKSADAKNWQACPVILKEPGHRRDDGTIGGHADVLVHRDRAYCFYFTHPEVSLAQRQDPDFPWKGSSRRTSLQVAELTVQDGRLLCDRNLVQIDLGK